MNGLVRIALSLASVPDSLVADIERELPGASRLIAAAKVLKPDLEKLEPLYEQAEPIVQRMLPTIKAAWPDLAALLPVAEKVVAFIQK